MTRFVDFRDATYIDILARQHEIFDRRVELSRLGEDTGDDTVMIVTHRPVYTLGRHASVSNVTRPEWVDARGAAVIRIDRGGDVTFHGPGQLVVYPIIDLKRRGMGVKEYVSLLEEGVIRTLAGYGVTGSRVEGATGVWIGAGTSSERKICAIGLRCARFITMHGLALNVDTDLSWFSAINPCGFTDKGVTTIYREIDDPAQRPEMEQVAASLRHHLSVLLKL